MAKIQELLTGKDERIDYYQLISRFPWIIESNQKCILSPDSDGLLCGLLMSYYLNWEVVGFYDGKILLCKNNITPSDCVFLDMEIYRKNVRSIGHHMVNYNKRIDSIDWQNYNNCIQPNLLRNYDAIRNFRLKYPLATIHFLIGIINQRYSINLSEDSVAPLLFTDGTFNVLFGYPENVLNWISYLRIIEESHPLNKIFCTNTYTPYKLMLEMDNFFRRRDEISIKRERGDRLKISDKEGKEENVIMNTNMTYDINSSALERIIRFISLLNEFTNWEYREKLWCWGGFNLYRFTKSDFKNHNKRVNQSNFNDMIKMCPLSWAMTSGDNIEYTLESPDLLK